MNFFCVCGHEHEVGEFKADAYPGKYLPNEKECSNKSCKCTTFVAACWNCHEAISEHVKQEAQCIIAKGSFLSKKMGLE